MPTEMTVKAFAEIQRLLPASIRCPVPGCVIGGDLWGDVCAACGGDLEPSCRDSCYCCGDFDCLCYDIPDGTDLDTVEHCDGLDCLCCDSDCPCWDATYARHRGCRWPAHYEDGEYRCPNGHVTPVQGADVMRAYGMEPML